MEERTEIHLIAFRGAEMHVAVPTGAEVVIHEADIIPIIDTHIHIESNNCCPLTLQWAQIANRVGWLLGRSMDSREEVNAAATSALIELFTGRFGEIGRISTDLIARVFMGDAQNSDMKETLYWTLISEERLTRIKTEKERREARADAEREGRLGGLSEEIIRDYDEFYENCAYYFYRTKPFHAFVALPMDLSFAHFWGKFGLPIYLPTEDAMYFINDFTRLNVRFPLTFSRMKTIGIDKDVLLPFTGRRVSSDECNEVIHLYADYEISTQYRHYREYRDRLESSERPVNKFYFHFSGSDEVLRSAAGKRYCHFVDIAPSEDDEKFEDFIRQYHYTLASAIRYPPLNSAQLFCFYHYDPRRHFTTNDPAESATATPAGSFRIAAGDTLLTFADRYSHIHGLSDNAEAAYTIWNHPRNSRLQTSTWHHPDYRGSEKARYVYLGNNRYARYVEHSAEFNTRDKLRQVVLHPDEEFYIPVTGSSTDETTGESKLRELAEKIVHEHAFFLLTPDSGTRVRFQDGDTYNHLPQVKLWTEGSGADYFYQLLRTIMRTNEAVFKDMLHHSSSTKGLFWGIKMYPNLGYAPDDFETFPHLRDFYAQCQTARIPITFHSSPGGMSIADPHNYVRFDGRSIQGSYPFKESFKHITDNLSAPANWEKVLTEYRELKLCMAHFGGDDVWKDSDLDYNFWIDDIVRLIKTYNNVYTDISYFTNPDPFLFWRRREVLARNLAAKIRSCSDLKHRILMGSDWYMIELDRFRGVGTYYRKMFALLKLVSQELGWDAWHQFAVINPLRYLGLIDETKGDNGPYTIRFDSINKYREHLIVWLNDLVFLEDAEINDSEKEDILAKLDNTSINTYISSPDYTILDADQIKKDGHLTILSE